MPIYEYKCIKCGEIFEAFQRINDDPLKSCKFCGGTVEKIFSQTSFQLKGSGWYLTDYARKPQASGDSKDSGTKTAAKSEPDAGKSSDTSSPAASSSEK